MMDSIAFYGARAGTVALLNVAGLPDTHTFVNGNNVAVPSPCNKIAGIFCCSQATAGSLTNQIRFSSPSLGRTSLIDICNHNANGAVVAAAQIPDANAPFNDFHHAPRPLNAGESLQMTSAVDVAAAAENIFGIVFLTDGNMSLPDVLPNPIETVIFDGQAAAVINTWSPSALVPRQNLQKGTYACVGMKYTGTSGVAARLSGFINQTARPAVIATNSPVGAAGVGSFADSVDQAQGLFRYGRMGVLGVFPSESPPQSEIICSVADAAITQHWALDLIRLTA
jgi:hypothetical protein